jgi:hypothetical protein
MSTLALTRTLRHTSRETARVRSASVSGSLRSVGRARDFEVLAAGVVGLAVFGGTERSCWGCGWRSAVGTGRGREGPLVEKVHDDGCGVHVVLDGGVG